MVFLLLFVCRWRRKGKLKASCKWRMKCCLLCFHCQTTTYSIGHTGLGLYLLYYYYIIYYIVLSFKAVVSLPFLCAGIPYINTLKHNLVHPMGLFREPRRTPPSDIPTSRREMFWTSHPPTVTLLQWSNTSWCLRSPIESLLLYSHPAFSETQTSLCCSSKMSCFLNFMQFTYFL